LRLPPQAIEAERSVLGSILIDKDVWDELQPLISEDDFYTSDHKTIYKAMCDLKQKESVIDIITLSNAIGMLEYIVEISSSVPTTANVKSYAKIVRDKAILRNLIKSSSDIVNKCYEQEEETEKIIGQAETDIMRINESKSKANFVKLKDCVIEARYNGSAWDVFFDIDTAASGFIVDADVSATAAIQRSKLASGTANHVVINSGAGVMTSEALLANTRGGTGKDTSADTGVAKVAAGT